MFPLLSCRRFICLYNWHYVPPASFFAFQRLIKSYGNIGLIEEETCELNNQLLPSTSALISTTQKGDTYPEAEKILDDMSKPIVSL